MNHIRYALIGIVVIALMLGVVLFVRMHMPASDVLIPTISPNTEDIVVRDPQPHTTVQNPVRVKGTVSGGGWFFEGVFPVRLMTQDGTVVASESVQALSDWMSTGTVPFDTTISYVVASDTPMIVALHNANASGLPQYDKEVRIPVTLKGQEVMRVNVFWGHESPNIQGQPAGYDCSDLIASQRVIVKTVAPARIALESLLKGPTFAEQQNGLFTSINPGVTVKNISIQNGTAYVDFDKTLETGVAGSCRVTVIRAQITKTLEQFSTVKNVVISIDGGTRDILQP